MTSKPTPAGDTALADDEIVAEVRAIRSELARAAGNDPDRLYEQWKAVELEERKKGRVILAPPALAGKPGAAA